MKNLEQEIRKLLKKSSIKENLKDTLAILLPTMDMQAQKRLFEALDQEKTKMRDLDEKEKRTALKYRVMIENLVKAAKS